jgi:hypothetical protein
VTCCITKYKWFNCLCVIAGIYNVIIKLINAFKMFAVQRTFMYETSIPVNKSVYIYILGLKRKFSFSYFRESFAKICFRFLRKKLTKSYENNESFFENFRENWRWKRKCQETSEFHEANEVEAEGMQWTDLGNVQNKNYKKYVTLLGN